MRLSRREFLAAAPMAVAVACTGTKTPTQPDTSILSGVNPVANTPPPSGTVYPQSIETRDVISGQTILGRCERIGLPRSSGWDNSTLEEVMQAAGLNPQVDSRGRITSIEGRAPENLIFYVRGQYFNSSARDIKLNRNDGYAFYSWKKN